MILPSAIPQIFFENKEVVCVLKPANFLSVRSRFHNRNPQPNIFDFFTEQMLLPVHRLDYEVPGLLLAARTKSAQRILSSYFENRHIEKTYWALTTGCDLSLLSPLPFVPETIDLDSPREFNWESSLLRGKKRSYASPLGSPSQTRAAFVHSQKIDHQIVNCWKLFPRSGRPHQLRYELAKHSQPIVGDALYFAPHRPTFKLGIALIAVALNFSRCPGRADLNLPEEIRLEIDWDFLVQQVNT